MTHYFCVFFLITMLACSVIEVGPTVLPPTETTTALPDLTILLDVLFYQIDCHGIMPYVLTIHNGGLSNAGAFDVQIDNTFIRRIDSLTIGETVTIEYLGGYTFVAVAQVDPHHEVAELNEQNNESKVDIMTSVMPAPTCMPTPFP